MLSQKQTRATSIGSHCFSESLSFMAQVLALSNQKGGVGKTTSSVSIAAQLAMLGFKVLLLDFDPQASATSGVGVEKHPEGADLYDIFFGRLQLSELTVPCSVQISWWCQALTIS